MEQNIRSSMLMRSDNLDAVLYASLTVAILCWLVTVLTEM